MNGSATTLVVGIGNLLMGDDGVGCHAIAALQRDPPPGVVLLDAGTAVINFLPEIERASAVLFIDAFHGGGAPGSLYTMDARSVAEPPAGASLHDVGLSAALRWLPPEHLAKPLLLLGVEPTLIAYSTDLSPAVQAALPALLEAAREWIANDMPVGAL